MQWKNVKIGGVAVAAVVSVFAASLYVRGAECTTAWRGGALAQRFSEPFTRDNVPLLSLTCALGRYAITIGDGRDDLYIYKYAYLTEDGNAFTRRIALQGGRKAGAWFIGSAQASVPFFATHAQKNYIAFYACVRRTNGTFACGCSGSGVCSAPHEGRFRWYVGVFSSQQPGTSPAPQPVQSVAAPERQSAATTRPAVREQVRPTVRSAVPTSVSQPTQRATSSSYAVPVALPSCDSAGTLVIDSVDDWAQVNNSQYTNFCVKPGDYRAAGVITLTSSGTANRKRVIQLMNGNDTHPARLPDAQQAFLGGLRFGDGATPANHWIVDRMSFVDLSTPHITGIERGSSDNIINRWRYERNNSGIDIQDRADRNVIQNSYIGNTTLDAVKSDFVCIGLQAYAHGGRRNVIIRDTKIVGNEMFNCNDAIQLIRNGNDRNGSFPGTLIADNDISVRTDRHTNCGGASQPNGPCSIAENAIDVKGGSDEAARPVRIVDNRMWGIKRSDPTIVPGGSWGDAIVVHYDTQNLIIENNAIFDSSRGVVVHLGSHNVRVDNNIIADIPANTDGAGYGIVFTSEAGGNNSARGNVLLRVAQPITNSAGATVAENVIDAASTRTCVTIMPISAPQEKCF